MNPIRNTAGFVLPVVLGIILIAALIAVQAATDLGNTTVLSTQRLLHLRAFESAEGGIVTVLDQLESGSEPAGTQTLRTQGSSADSAIVETVATFAATPAGFSADRVTERRYEIRSTGFSARGSKVAVVQGVRQFQAATP